MSASLIINCVCLCGIASLCLVGWICKWEALLWIRLHWIARLTLSSERRWKERGARARFQMRTTEIVFLFIDRAPWLHKVPHCDLWVYFSIRQSSEKAEWYTCVCVDLTGGKTDKSQPNTQWAERKQSDPSRHGRQEDRETRTWL